MGHKFTPDPTVDLNQNKGPGLMVVAIVLPSLSTFIVCIRLYVRLFVVRSCGRDDYLILASSVSPMVLSKARCLLMQDRSQLSLLPHSQ
jgi:hypothetical protein